MHYALDDLDKRLPRFIVSHAVGVRIQSGHASLMSMPFRPQPSVCPSKLRQLGIPAASETDVLSAVRLAFNMGLIQPHIAPIRIGYAFELTSECVPGKCQKIGTGIVTKIGITRLASITEKHRQQCGYSTLAEFNDYWGEAAADLTQYPNPWCWLIEFIFKG